MKQLAETRANVFYQKEEDGKFKPIAELVINSVQIDYHYTEEGTVQKLLTTHTERTTATFDDLLKLSMTIHNIMKTMDPERMSKSDLEE